MRLVIAQVLRFHVAIGETQRAGEQYVVHGVAGARARRAEPRIGELPRRESVVGSGQLQIGFTAEYELSILPVVSALHAAGEAGDIREATLHVSPFLAPVQATTPPRPIATGPLRRAVIR